MRYKTDKHFTDSTQRASSPIESPNRDSQAVKMRQQVQYPDSGAGAYVGAHLQHMSSQTQRMHRNSTMNHFQGRLDALRRDEEHAYTSSKGETQWQWDQDGSLPLATKPMSPHMYSEDRIGDASRPFYPGQRADSKTGFDKQGNKEPRAQLNEQDMELGYEDNPLPQTFEGLEQKFHDEIMKLAKEQHDAEDAENARHRERLNEINANYQERLAALRTQQAGRRDEFLRRESQLRQQQYQQAGKSHYQNSTVPTEPHAYGGAGGAAAAAVTPEARRAYTPGHIDSYRERPQYHVGARNHHGFEARGPYPGGRAYNNTNARNY
ncbi:hypothetical protein Sjap_012556 [Stephania japonica]|uniref:Uncharacterized protein n=1 Tax=Stephania japonica TaxID=461633 RepID=A0AAP0IWB1_9MAGN